MLRKKQEDLTEKETYFDNVKRCIQLIDARKRLGMPVGGTLQSLERLLKINVNCEDVHTDDYICAVMIDGFLAEAVKPTEDPELSDEMRPATYLSTKEHITFYSERMLPANSIVIFTDQRVLYAKWKHQR